MRSSLFLTNGTPQARIRRLLSKLLGTPFLPLLAWSKVVESLFTAVPFAPSMVAAVVLTVLWVFGEDALEYAKEEVSGDK